MFITERFGTIDDRINSYDPSYNVLARKTCFLGDHLDVTYHLGKNIITNDGDLYYAQQAAGETPTNDFDGANGRIELQNPASADTPAKTDTYGDVSSPITASRATFDATYPKTNDTDTDNTGKAVDAITWKKSYGTSDFDTESANNITGGCIHIGGATPSAGTLLLTHFNFSSSFEKLSTDTLTVWINHLFNGV